MALFDAVSGLSARAQILILPRPSHRVDTFPILMITDASAGTVTYLGLVEELDRDTDRAGELAHIGGECATRRKNSLRGDPRIKLDNTRRQPLNKNQAASGENSAVGWAARTKMEVHAERRVLALSSSRIVSALGQELYSTSDVQTARTCSSATDLPHPRNMSIPLQ